MKPTLVVYLDGLSYNDLNKEKTPFLHSLSEKFSKARLKTLLAYKGIEFAFYTGKYPDETNIWQEFIYSPRTSIFKYFSWMPLPRNILSYGVALAQYLLGKTALCRFENIPKKLAKNFDVSSKHKPWKYYPFTQMNFVYYGWPFFVKDGKYSLDPIKRRDSYKVDKFLKHVDDPSYAYFIHLVELDKTTHQHGRNGAVTLECIKRQDKLIEKMFAHFKKVFGDFNFILWSDHGFYDVKKYVKPPIESSDECIPFYASTIANFWFKNEHAKNAALKKLKNVKEGTILTNELKKKYHIPLERKHGEVNFVLKPGYAFSPDYYQEKPFISMHGYQPEKADTDAFLVSNLKIEGKEVEMTYGYKLLKKALN